MWNLAIRTWKSRESYKQGKLSNRSKEWLSHHGHPTLRATLVCVSVKQSISQASQTWQPRLARDSDIAALQVLIPLSVRKLQASYYTPLQMDAAVGTIFAVDRQLIRDGTYFVVEQDGQIIGCGGWSKRLAVCGGDHDRPEPDPEIDPRRDPARIRAFFVHPASARQGIGRSILHASEQAAIAAAFSKAELVATLAGEPLYAACGYSVVERYELEAPGGVTLPVVRMTRTLRPNLLLYGTS